jgi:hypothetical protein
MRNGNARRTTMIASRECEAVAAAARPELGESSCSSRFSERSLSSPSWMAFQDRWSRTISSQLPHAAKSSKGRSLKSAARSPLLHPNMASLYRSKVNQLAQALEHPETRTEAAEALRVLVEASSSPLKGRSLASSCEGIWRPCWEPPKTRRGRRRPATSHCR